MPSAGTRFGKHLLKCCQGQLYHEGISPTHTISTRERLRGGPRGSPARPLLPPAPAAPLSAPARGSLPSCRRARLPSLVKPVTTLAKCSAGVLVTVSLRGARRCPSPYERKYIFLLHAVTMVWNKFLWEAAEAETIAVLQSRGIPM